MKQIAWVMGLLTACCFYAGAQQISFDSLQQKTGLPVNDTLFALALIHKADEYARKDLSKFREYATAAAIFAKRKQLDRQLSAAYEQLTTYHEGVGQLDSARYFLSLLRQLAAGSSILSVQSNFNQAASLFYRHRGDYKSALPFMMETLRLNIKIGNPIYIAGQYLNVGNNLHDLGRLEEAITYHLKALDLFKSIGNKQGESFCYQSIGNDFNQLKQYSDALPYLNKSMQLKHELNDKRGKANAYADMATTYVGLKDDEHALVNLQHAMSINKELKLVGQEALNNYAIAEIYARNGKPALAMDYYERGKLLATQAEDKALLADIQSGVAKLQTKASQVKASEQNMLEALQTSKKLGDKAAEIKTDAILADFYAKNNQFEKALTYNKEFQSQTDSSENSVLRLKIKDLEQRYNYDKQEKEIALLKKDQLISQANLKQQKTVRYGLIMLCLLVATTGMLVIARFRSKQKSRRMLDIAHFRNQIARNLHDDIGSNLSSINILSKIVLAHAGDHPAIKSDLEKIKERSSTIMESMSDIVWAINPANDSIDKTILKMKEFAAEIAEPEGINLKFREGDQLNGIKLGIKQRKDLYLIYKEAINNAVKYSCASEICTDLRYQNNMFALIIADDGKGFDSTKTGSGNGLINMKSRAQEMKASLDIRTAPGQGTTVTLELQLT